jgi:hypothetical protein
MVALSTLEANTLSSNVRKKIEASIYLSWGASATRSWFYEWSYFEQPTYKAKME